LLEGADHLRIHGRDVPVKARFIVINGLSGHADRNELMRWIREGGAEPRRVFVTHGEPEAAESLAARIEQEIGAEVHIPGLDSSYDL
jgi:metallo-beta-lactamase family protein